MVKNEIGWFFKIIEPGTPERNPRETEFFKLTSPSEALVREFIQNALDARKNSGPVKIRIAFDQIENDNFNLFLDETLKRHLNACKILNKYQISIPYLIMEDFGTTGLDGPINPDAGKGNFYDFWWREGISEKGQQRAGRWGLGKTTFHLVSKIRTIFGFTIRDDGKSLLMGKALLKAHKLDEQRFHYFGYFSKMNYEPVDDLSIVNKFKNIFKISRKENETGFSLVIPIIEDIIYRDIKSAVIMHYFYPILKGELDVTIIGPCESIELKKDNLIEISEKNWKDFNIKEIFNFIKNSLDGEEIHLKFYNDNLEITKESFGDKLEKCKMDFLNGLPLKFRIPILITEKFSIPIQTYLTVYIKKFDNLKSSFESYIRSGILISDIKNTLGKRPVAGILVAEDQKISEFLGDCENPAHTNWNERTEGFSEKYKDAASILRFIKNLMYKIISILDEPPTGRYDDLLKDIFYIKPPKSDKFVEGPGTNGNGHGNDGGPELFKIEEVCKNNTQSGFKITLDKNIDENKNISTFPKKVNIKVAYDTRRGNPFTQYDRFDFDFGDDKIIITYDDCKIISKKLNEIQIEITGINFYLKVLGFNNDRDLVVKINSV
jgi:hypothetical protein